MLRAVTFDFWGTLYQNVYAREDRLRLLQDALKRHGQPRSLEDLDAAYEHARSVWDRVWREERRSISIRRWLGEMLTFLNAELPGDTMSDVGRAIQEIYLCLDVPRPVPGVLEVVPRLARRYRLGLISDVGLTPGRVLREVLRRDCLLQHLQAVTFSDEIGSAKPHPKPFLHTLEVLDTPPDEAVHIGDLPETDLTGAREVGMKAVLFLGVTNREDGRSLADGVFEDYCQLQELLESLA